MTPRYASAFPRRDTPELCKNYSLKKPFAQTEGVGNAGCPPHPQPRVQRVVKHTSVVAEGNAGTPGIPAREWF